ncbi:MAG: hypothetical protein ACRDUA_10300 [Micromonosporaceae bacterium]
MTDAPPEPSARDERLVADAFAAFRDSNRSSFPTPPIERVYAQARRQQHQRRYRSGIAAAAALVLLVAVTVLFNLVGSDQGQPTADGTPAASEPPAGSATPSRPHSPDPSDGTKRPEQRNPLHPRGNDLANATIELAPINGCGGGALQFSEGHANDAGGCGWQIGYAAPRYPNLDRTGRPEIVTTVSAGGGTGVVALQVPPRGALTTMGYVVVGEPGTQTVESISVSDDGLIRVGLSDSTYDTGSPQRQTRGYRWAASAQAFVQVEGPTSFPSPEPDPSQPPASTSPSAGE